MNRLKAFLTVQAKFFEISAFAAAMSFLLMLRTPKGILLFPALVGYWYFASIHALLHGEVVW